MRYASARFFLLIIRENDFELDYSIHNAEGRTKYSVTRGMDFPFRMGG